MVINLKQTTRQREEINKRWRKKRTRKRKRERERIRVCPDSDDLPSSYLLDGDNLRDEDADN